MKTSVTIDGVVLTRGQVERALADLNKPEPVRFFAGTRVRMTERPKIHFVVADQFLTELLEKRYSTVAQKGDIWCISLDTGAVHNFQPSQIEVVSQ